MTAALASPAGAAAVPVPDEPLVLVMPGQRRFTTALRDDLEVEPLRAPRRFRNGELITEVPPHVHGRSCVLVASVAPPPGAVERLTMTTQALRRAGATGVRVVLPYLAYARQDVAEPHESLGLAWLGALLAAGGVDEVICVDAHSDRAAGLLGLPLRSLSPAEALGAALPDDWRRHVTFVAPDEGAVNRCMALTLAVGAPEQITWLRKRRTRTGVEHRGVVGTPGPRAVIVDDILDTGGTMLSCCRELAAVGVEEIGIVVTHALFTGVAWRELFRIGVRRVWTTDTVLSRRRPDRVVVVPVAPLLAAHLTAGGAAP